MLPVHECFFGNIEGVFFNNIVDMFYITRDLYEAVALVIHVLGI